MSPVTECIATALCGGGEEQLSVHETHADIAERVAEALIEAGYVAPVARGWEYGVRSGACDGAVAWRFGTDEHAARAEADRFPKDRQVVRRPVGAWEDVPVAAAGGAR